MINLIFYLIGTLSICLLTRLTYIRHFFLGKIHITMNTTNARVTRYKTTRRPNNLVNYISPTYLSDLASQFCPTVSIQDDKSNNEEFEKMENQVAGHQFVEGQNTIGLLKCKNGTILKPITKPESGLREIRFYEQLQTTSDPVLLELKEFSPKFYGTRMIDINGKKTEFIILEDLLKEFHEPCIMDVKMGRQTWDPSASEEKIANEKEKYKKCKEDVAFCVPGFHVYKFATGRLHKYNKEYGKKLNGTTVSDALNVFLNGDPNGNVNRELLMQLLTILWKIQKWARTQTSIRLYCTSLLIVYDFKVLRSLMSFEPSVKHCPQGVLNVVQRKTSFTTPNYSVDGSSSFSGEVSETGPVYRTQFLSKTSPIENTVCDRTVSPDSQTSWHKDFHKTRRSHSFHINYNDYLSKIKLDYSATLDELQGKTYKRDNNWCSVHVIDFAHVYPSEDHTVDTNYIQGIDNLVDILEKFLYSWR